jgi:uncharacterized protein YndB with AHSA1/START domain
MTAGTTIEVSRVLPAPVDEVFRWWTEPELLSRWMSPVGSVDAEVDLKVGGSFRIVMKDAGVEIDHTGEYLEIERPHRLTFTWRSQYAGASSQVTVSFEPEGPASTRLVIVHSGLPEAVAEEHLNGWGTMAHRLATEMQAA